VATSALAVMIGLATLVTLTAEVGTILIIDRASSGGNELFAGSGGAVQQSDMSLGSTALTGAFGFSDTASVGLTESDPFSAGAAMAEGSISVSDNVVQSSSASLFLTGSRTASGSATYVSGTGNATSRQQQEFRVRFQVIGDDAAWSLTGSFDPGLDTSVFDAGNLLLHRPFTANQLIDVTTATVLNESGTLDAGKTYELRIRVTDVLGASAGMPFEGDASSFNIQFNVTSLVPESSVLAFLAPAGIVLAARRKRVSLGSRRTHEADGLHL